MTTARTRAGLAACVLPAALAVLAAPAARAQSSYPSAVLADGPQAYFRLGSVSQGSQVNGYTTTFNGGAAVTAPGGGAPLAGDPNNVGAAFDGTSGTDVFTSFVSSGASDPSATHAATILAWVDLTQLPSATGRIFYVAGRSQNGNDLDLQIQQDNRLYFYTNASANMSFALPTTGLLNAYHFIAATDDPTTGVRSLYFDGSLVAQDTNVGDRGVSTSVFTIGESSVFGGRAFQGNVDEVALYNKPLTSVQIQGLYQSSLATAPKPPQIAALGLAGLILRDRRRASMKG